MCPFTNGNARTARQPRPHPQQGQPERPQQGPAAFLRGRGGPRRGLGGGAFSAPFRARGNPRDPARRGPRSRSLRLRPLYPAPAGRPPLLGSFRLALLGVGPARLAGGSGVSICKGCARPRIDDCIYKHALGLYSCKPSGLPFVYLLPLSNTAVHFPLPAV